MSALAAWCAGVSVLLWLGHPEKSWAAWLAGTANVLSRGTRDAWILTGTLSAWMAAAALRRRRHPSGRALRESLVRFWQEVGVLLTAGLTFWRAVEIAAESEPLLTGLVQHAASQVAQHPHGRITNPGFPDDEGEMTLLLLQHGYLHGAAPAQIQAEVRHMEARLAFEEEAKRRRDPLWMTVLPALLLLNVLWLFVAPMIAMASHSWMKL